MKNKDKILNLYYVQHLKVKEISALLEVSSVYVSRIIKNDTRYKNEKNNRKDISKVGRKIAQKKFAKQKRERKRIEDNCTILEIQHRQAVQELSKSSYLSNDGYRKWNKSAYKYNPSKKRYEFDSCLGRSQDIPKYIKERWCFFLEEKLLKILKLADELNEKQDKLYAEINYKIEFFLI